MHGTPVSAFLTGPYHFSPTEKVEVKPKEQKPVVLEVPFEEEITGMAITKLLGTKEQMTLTMKIKFIRNRATFKVKNDTHENCDFGPNPDAWHYRLKIPGVL